MNFDIVLTSAETVYGAFSCNGEDGNSLQINNVSADELKTIVNILSKDENKRIKILTIPHKSGQYGIHGD